MAKYLYGLDLSLSQTGVTIYDLDSKDVIYIGHLNTEHIKKKKGVYQNAKKLLLVAEYFIDLKEKYPPHVVAIERGFSRFNTSTQVIYRVHGLVNYLFHEVDQIYYPVKTVKEAILNGNATKEDVKNAILANYDYLVFENEDESDSFAVMLTYLIKNNLIVFEKPVYAPKKKKPTKRKKAETDEKDDE